MKFVIAMVSVAVFCSTSCAKPAPKQAARAGIAHGFSPTNINDPRLRRISMTVTREGPRNYLRSLNDETPDWQYLLDRMETGNAQALAIGAVLRPMADAGVAEALDTSAARALPQAPETVLALSRKGFNVAKLCTSPFIEPLKDVERKYNQAALRALDAMPVADRAQPAFDECHSALTVIAADIATHP